MQQSQAIALSVQADKFGGYGLKLSGYQDTLYANVGGCVPSLWKRESGC